MLRGIFEEMSGLDDFVRYGREVPDA